MEAILDAARVDNTPCLPQGQDYTHIPKKVALFRHAPALKRATRGVLKGGIPPFMRGMEGGHCPLRSRATRNIRSKALTSYCRSSHAPSEHRHQPTGLVNGAIGTIRAIAKRHVSVQFDHMTEPYNVEMVKC